MPRKYLFNRLEHARDLGLLSRTTRTAQLLLPVPQWQQQLVSPLGPLWGHGHLCQVLVYRQPPKIDQGGDAGKLLADLVQGVFFPRQPIGLKQRFDRLEFGSQLFLNLL